MSKYDASVTTKRKNKEEEEQKTLGRTFVGWVNFQLQQRNIKINDIYTDLCDGVNLIHLLEVISNKSLEQTLSAKIKKNAVSTVQKVENVALALKFLNEQMNIKVVINPQDLVDGNKKVIIQLMWRLISSGIAKSAESTDATEAKKEDPNVEKGKIAKEKLMEWCKQQVQGYKNVDVDDFEDSFTDGLGFCALIHKFNPSLINFDALDKNNAKENLTLAFQLAEQHLAVPALLDVEEVAEGKTDERSIVIYLSQYLIAFLTKTKVDAAKNVETLQQEIDSQKAKQQELLRIQQEELKREEEQRQLQLEEHERLRREQEELEHEINQVNEQEYPELYEERKELLTQNRKLKEELEMLQKQKEQLNKEILITKGKLIGSLVVTIHGGRKLREKLLPLDSFVNVSLDNQAHRTRTKMRTNNPSWEQSFTLFVSDENSNLDIVVHSWHLLWKPGFRGKVSIPIKQLQKQKLSGKWIELEPDEGKKAVPYGDIQISVTYKEGI